MKHEHEMELKQLKIEFSLNLEQINWSNNASRSLKKKSLMITIITIK